MDEITQGMCMGEKVMLVRAKVIKYKDKCACKHKSDDFLWEEKGGREEELNTPKLRLEMLQSQNFLSPEIPQVETSITDMLKEHSLRTLFI